MLRQVITCDHCGTEIGAGAAFACAFSGSAYAFLDVHGCSKEHLGLALAKTFGVPIDGNWTTKIDLANAAVLKIMVDIDEKNKRIADLEKQLEGQHWLRGEKNRARHEREAAAKARLKDLTAQLDSAAQAYAHLENECNELCRINNELIAEPRAAVLLEKAIEKIMADDLDSSNTGTSPMISKWGAKRVINEIINSLTEPTKPTDHVHELGSCSHCDTKSITDTNKPTKPLVATLRHIGDRLEIALGPGPALDAAMGVITSEIENNGGEQ